MYFRARGNLDVSPMFVRTPAPGIDGEWGSADDDYGNLRLLSDSPSIDAGDPGHDGADEIDCDNHARVLCGRLDMGAYESGIGDGNCDHAINLADFAALQICFTGGELLETGCEAFDFDGDMQVSAQDYAAFQALFVD